MDAGESKLEVPPDSVALFPARSLLASRWVLPGQREKTKTRDPKTLLPLPLLMTTLMPCWGPHARELIENSLCPKGPSS